MSFNILKSKTVWGTVTLISGWLATLPVIDLKHIAMGLGGLLATIGARDALTKPAE